MLPYGRLGFRRPGLFPQANPVCPCFHMLGEFVEGKLVEDCELFRLQKLFEDKPSLLLLVDVAGFADDTGRDVSEWWQFNLFAFVLNGVAHAASLSLGCCFIRLDGVKLFT